MPEHPFTAEDLQALSAWDTPTICNGLELIEPNRRTIGFTVQTMIAADRSLKPMVGLARVGTMRAQEAPRGPVANRMDWYEYVAKADMPTVVVIQDLDDQPGYGAIWGEVHAALHKALGARGCVTNGSFRDADMLAEGFQILAGVVAPSHAWSHFVDYGRPVKVFGMQAEHDDVIHADRHGAVVIPAEAVRKLPEALDLLARREQVILDICKDPAFSIEALRDAMKRSGEIH